MPRKRQMPKGMWNRNGVYYARFRTDGRMICKRLSTDFDAACQLLNEVCARVDRADFGILDNDCPWSELKREFLAWARQSVRRPHEYESDLKRFESFSPIRSAQQIGQKHVIAFRQWRLGQTVGGRPKGKNVTARTVNREVGTINNMLNHAVEWGRIGSNPLEGLKPLAHDSAAKQRRPLAIAEVEALFEHSPEHLKPVWRMFACTGMRHDELVNLRFDDIDFERRTVTVRASRAKNHKAREIPLDDAMLDMLRDLQAAAKQRKPVAGNTPAMTTKLAGRLSRDHVFVTLANTPMDSNLLSRFYKACRKAGIDDAVPGGAVDIHSLRVTFTTLSLEHGANPKAVQAILGHSTLGMTMSVYAKATERSKREAIGALPFAKATNPGHIVSVQNARAVSTVESESPQILAVSMVG